MTTGPVTKSLLYSSVFALLTACGTETSTNTETKASADSKNVAANDTKYIKIEDAKEFLPDWSKENVLVYNVVGEPDEMHPTNGILVYRQEIMGYTQVYLIGTDFQTLTLRPIAVKSMPKISENGKEYTYELNKRITFDDGSPLSVDDILFTFKANKNPLTNNPSAKTYLDNLIDIVPDKTNPDAFTIIMKEKYIQNISFLSEYPIMQRKFFDPKNVLANYTFANFNDKTFKADAHKDLSDWSTEFNSPKYSRDPQYTVGAGPYRMEKWDAGQSITLVKKKKHWTDGMTETYYASYPDKIIFKLNKDPNSVMLEFKAQSIDASTSLSNKTLSDLQADAGFTKNYNSRFTDTYNYGYIAMNMKPDGVKHKKLFVDKKVRRAMALLTPLDELNRITNKNRNKRTVGPVSPLKPEYNSDLKLIPFDIEAAKKLLDEAGWKDTDGDNIRDKMIDGEKVKMEFNLGYFTTSVEWKDMAKMVSEQMYKAGVVADPDPLDPSVLFEQASTHNFDMVIASWAGNVFPEDYTQIWHTSAWTSKGSNFTGFGNAETDALIDSIKYTLDDEKRIKMLKRFQEIVYDEQPYIFMFAGLRRNVIHKRFGNQEMYFERPGVWLSNLKLLSNAGSAPKMSATPN
ncbi:MAG: ABC transporter substrate-binding protein [Bacteroidia bacterium]